MPGCHAGRVQALRERVPGRQPTPSFPALHHTLPPAQVREITALWQTDELRRHKPTPLDEARGGLHIVEQSLWSSLPKLLRRLSGACRTAAARAPWLCAVPLRRPSVPAACLGARCAPLCPLCPHPGPPLPCLAGTLKKHTGRELPIDACPMHFGSWMGGDRDGNPNVTAKVGGVEGFGERALGAQRGSSGTGKPSRQQPGARSTPNWRCRPSRLPTPPPASLPAHAQTTHDVACLSRWMAADLYLKEVDALRFELSMSHASDEVRPALQRSAAAWIRVLPGCRLVLLLLCPARVCALLSLGWEQGSWQARPACPPSLTPVPPCSAAPRTAPSQVLTMAHEIARKHQHHPASGRSADALDADRVPSGALPACCAACACTCA